MIRASVTLLWCCDDVTIMLLFYVIEQKKMTSGIRAVASLTCMQTPTATRRRKTKRRIQKQVTSHYVTAGACSASLIKYFFDCHYVHMPSK